MIARGNCKNDSMLRTGQYFRNGDGKLFRVQHANECRAHCIPLDGTTISIPASTENGTTPGNGKTFVTRRAIDIAPGAIVTVLTEQEALASLALQQNKEQTTMNSRTASTSTAKTSAQRSEEKAARATTPTRTVQPCKCGCGEEVSSHFMMGHDARFKGWLLKVERGQMPLSQLPPSVRKAYQWVEKGEGYIPTTNYKGEPHTGYDTKPQANKAKAPKAQPKAQVASPVAVSKANGHPKGRRAKLPIPTGVVATRRGRKPAAQVEAPTV